MIVTTGSTTEPTSHEALSSTGGTIVDGSVSPSGSQYKVFSVVNGSVAVTYSTAGAVVGTARVFILPALTNGSRNGAASLVGGSWPINIQ